MEFIHSSYNNKNISIALSQIVAVAEGNKGNTLIYCTDDQEYTVTESYDLIMKKIMMRFAPNV